MPRGVYDRTLTPAQRQAQKEAGKAATQTAKEVVKAVSPKKTKAAEKVPEKVKGKPGPKPKAAPAPAGQIFPAKGKPGPKPKTPTQGAIPTPINRNVPAPKSIPVPKLASGPQRAFKAGADHTPYEPTPSDKLHVLDYHLQTLTNLAQTQNSEAIPLKALSQALGVTITRATQVVVELVPAAEVPEGLPASLEEIRATPEELKTEEPAQKKGRGKKVVEAPVESTPPPVPAPAQLTIPVPAPVAPAVPPIPSAPGLPLPLPPPLPFNAPTSNQG